MTSVFPPIAFLKIDTLLSSNMKSVFSLLLPVVIAAALSAAPPARANALLWFSIDPEAQVLDANGLALGTIASYRSESGLAINTVRVRADGSDPEEYLTLGYEEPEHVWHLVEGVDSADVGSSGAPMQPAGLPSGIGASDTFTLVLGFYNDNNDSFTTLATVTESYENLAGAGHVSENGLSPQSQTAWTPDRVTAVPEPTTALLGLLGAGLLLRRRRPARARGRDARAPAR